MRYEPQPLACVANRSKRKQGCFKKKGGVFMWDCRLIASRKILHFKQSFFDQLKELQHSSEIQIHW